MQQAEWMMQKKQFNFLLKKIVIKQWNLQKCFTVIIQKDEQLIATITEEALAIIEESDGNDQQKINSCLPGTLA